MQIWVIPEDMLSVTFLIPKEITDEDQLVVFHLSIPMGYMESAALFCATIEALKEMAL